MDVPGIINLRRAGEVFVSGAIDDSGLKYIQSEGVTEIIDLRRAEEVDPDYVKAVVPMGGVLAVMGNVSPVASANILGDPHAADIVLGTDWDPRSSRLSPRPP